MPHGARGAATPPTALGAGGEGADPLSSSYARFCVINQFNRHSSQPGPCREGAGDAGKGLWEAEAEAAEDGSGAQETGASEATTAKTRAVPSPSRPNAAAQPSPSLALVRSAQMGSSARGKEPSRARPPQPPCPRQQHPGLEGPRDPLPSTSAQRQGQAWAASTSSGLGAASSRTTTGTRHGRAPWQLSGVTEGPPTAPWCQEDGGCGGRAGGQLTSSPRCQTAGWETQRGSHRTTSVPWGSDEQTSAPRGSHRPASAPQSSHGPGSQNPSMVGVRKDLQGHPAQPPAQAGSPRAGCTAPWPGGAGTSPEKETPQPPWAAWARAPSPSEGRSSSSSSAGASSASICAHCPLSCCWAPLERVWPRPPDPHPADI